MERPPDPTGRFSDRVEDYVRYRPRYPSELIPLLRSRIGLQSDWVVGDLGSGTGFSAEPLLDNGNTVIGVEPNPAMRAAAERVLSGRPGFTTVPGTAEATGLPDQSVDLIIAGQAFHWFDPKRSRAEAVRILRPPRPVVLVWNTRRPAAGGFPHAYEELLTRYGTDYEQVRHDRIGAHELAGFYRTLYHRDVLPNEQTFDLEGMQGRLLSSSYTPPPGDPQREPMLAALQQVFEHYQEGGLVRLEYDTEVYTGQLGG